MGAVSSRGVPQGFRGFLWTKILDALVGGGVQGDILYRGASLWSRLAAGTAGYLLSTNGSGADPSYIPSTGIAGGSTLVYATGTKTKTSDTSLTADPDTALNVTLSADKKYRVRYDIAFDAQATPGVKWDIDFTGTVTSVLIKALNGNVTTSTLSTGSTVAAFTLFSASAINVVRVHSITGSQTVILQIVVNISVGASGGTLKLRWAQNTSSTTSVTRRANASILVTEAI